MAKLTNTFEVLRGVPALTLLGTALFIFLTRVIPLAHPHDPWADEAMLMANLPLASLSALFHPLPLFEQTAPLGYLFLANTLTSMFPDEAVLVLRTLSAGASLLAASLIFVSLRRLVAGPAIALALTFACLTSFTVIYSVEIKQYIFEYLATAAMLYVSVRLTDNYNTKNLLYFVIGGVFSVIISFTAPIIIGAFGAGVMSQRWISCSGNPAQRRQFGLIAAMMLMSIAVLLYYFGYTRPVTEIQFAAWTHVYKPSFLTLAPPNWAWMDLWLQFPHFLMIQLDVFVGLTGPDYPWVIAPAAIVYSVVFTVGMVTSTSRFVLLPATFIAAVVIICGLSLAQLLPIVHPRHFAFMVPITGIILGLGVFRCLHCLSRWAMPRQELRLVSRGSAVVIVLVGLLGLGRSGYLERQQISPLIDHIVSHGGTDTPVWVYYGAQPAMRVLASDTLRQIGLVSHASDVPSWWRKNRSDLGDTSKDSYFDDFRRTIRGLPQIWLLFSHYGFEPSLQRYLAIAQKEVGPCRQVISEKGAILWKCQ